MHKLDPHNCEDAPTEIKEAISWIFTDQTENKEFDCIYYFDATEISKVEAWDMLCREIPIEERSHWRKHHINRKWWIWYRSTEWVYYRNGLRPYTYM